MWEILPSIVVLLLFAAVPKIKLAGLNPQSIEFMERDIVDSSAEYTGNKIIPTVVDGNECGAYILVTLDGNDEDEIFQRAETLAEIGEEAGAFDTLVIEHPADKAAVWAARSAFLTVIEAETEHLDEMDVVVPVDKIAEFLGFIREMGVENDVLVRSFGQRVTATCIFIAAETILSVRRFLRSRRVSSMRRTRNGTSWAARLLASTAWAAK